METFRILCFSGNVLIHWREQQAANLVDCLSAIGDHDCHRIEVWSGSERVAVLRDVGSFPANRPIRRSA